jgi:hypothetical protein
MSRTRSRSPVAATAGATRRCPVCKEPHAADACCVPHYGARTAGMVDALAGRDPDTQGWPPGRYGHADYQLGYYSVSR